MGKRLYVGNLPYDADEETIRTAFTEGGGTVERVHIPLDRETQRPRGFAFVEMASDADAQKALAAMDGASMGTRSIRVSEAEERRPGGGSGGGGRPAGASPSGASSPDDRASAGSGGEAPRENRERRFGPDAKPARSVNRDRSKRGHGRRRNEDSGSDGGRRGGSRFSDSDYDY